MNDNYIHSSASSCPPQCHKQQPPSRDQYPQDRWASWPSGRGSWWADHEWHPQTWPHPPPSWQLRAGQFPIHHSIIQSFNHSIIQSFSIILCYSLLFIVIHCYSIILYEEREKYIHEEYPFRSTQQRSSLHSRWQALPQDRSGEHEQAEKER